MTWLSEHREFVYLFLAASSILFPLAIGVALGHVPKAILTTWAFPLTAGTLLLVFGIRFFESLENPDLRFGVNFLFGLIWELAGLNILRRKRSSESDVLAAAERTARTFGFMFLIFGGVWIAISAFQFFF